MPKFWSLISWLSASYVAFWVCQDGNHCHGHMQTHSHVPAHLNNATAGTYLCSFEMVSIDLKPTKLCPNPNHHTDLAQPGAGHSFFGFSILSRWKPLSWTYANPYTGETPNTCRCWHFSVSFGDSIKRPKKHLSYVQIMIYNDLACWFLCGFQGMQSSNSHGSMQNHPRCHNKSMPILALLCALVMASKDLKSTKLCPKI